MKRKTSKLLLALMPAWSLTALAASCNNPAATNDNANSNQQLKQDLKAQLNTETNGYTISLKDNSLLAKIPSEITFDNLQGINSNKNSDFIFQFTGELVPSQRDGSLQVSFYVRALDPETKKWVYSDVKTFTLSGFKNDNNLTDEALEQAKLEIKALDYKSLLPSEAAQRDFISLVNYNKDLYKANIELVPADEPGYLCVYYKLENIASQYNTKVMLQVIKGFKTTLERNKEQTKANLDSQMNSIARLIVESSIDKDETKASQITHNEVVFPQLVDAASNIIESSFDDEKGTYTVKFDLVSTIYPEIKSEEKTITISGFLTNGQIINKADNKFRKELHNFIVANPISFQYKENENRDHILPSNTNDADFKSLNVPEGLTLHIKSLNKDDSNGIISIIYTVSRLNPETNNVVETNEEQVATINGFYTQRQLEIDTEQARLDREISNFDLALLDTVNKAEVKASTISKISFDTNNLPQDANLQITFEPNDDKGEVVVTYAFISTKSALGSISSSTKKIVLNNFLTNEQEKINNLANEFSLDTSNISLDPTVYDKSSFEKLYLDKNTNEPYQITDKIKSLVVKSIDGAKFEITQFNYNIDLENDVFNFDFDIKLYSNVDKSVESNTKHISINMIPIIAQRFLPIYLEKGIYVRKTSYGNDIARKLKPSLVNQDLSLLFSISDKWGWTKRPNDKITLKSTNDAKGEITLSVTSKMGDHTASKDFTVNGFLTDKKYQQYVSDQNNLRDKLNNLVKNYNLNTDSDFLKAVNNKNPQEITSELLNGIKILKNEAKLILVPNTLNVQKETHSFTAQYKLQSTKYNFEDIVSDEIGTVTYNKLFDTTIFNEIFNANMKNLTAEVTNAESSYNKALSVTDKIPANRMDRFNSIKKELFTKIQEKMSQASLNSTRDFFNATFADREDLLKTYKVLDNLLMVNNNMNIVSDMYGGIYTTPYESLSPAVKALAWFDKTVVTAAKMIHGYYLEPLFDNVFNYIKNNEQTIMKVLNNKAFAEINNHEFASDIDKSKLTKAVTDILSETFNNYADFYLNIDWQFMVDGKKSTNVQTDRYRKTIETWPKLKPGRTWLTTNWADIWSSNRHNSKLETLISQLTNEYKLSDSDADFISKLIKELAFPIFNIGKNYSDVMYNDLLTIAYKLSGNKE
ncbi:lipoprotein 17-related variable surface protein [Mycoplasma sp. VS299A]|uniref:lipoprotein 17-related variable surface protein n=1 Tax=Mycoplasma sp. VS299A TaxID=3401690 RepID=UPI003AAC4A9B